MKKILNGLSVVALSAALLVAGGCGNDATQPTGVLNKAPVYRAEVTDGNNKTTTTDNNGRFRLSDGPYKSKGGWFKHPVTGAETPAPVLEAPKFARNITALTTLVNKNPLNSTLRAKIESLGISYDDALTTVTTTNKNAIALNECVGVALAALTKEGASEGDLNNFLTKLADTAQTATSEVTPANIASYVKTALTTTIFTTPAVLTAQSSIATQITNTGTAVDKLKVGDTLTGATGGSSATPPN